MTVKMQEILEFPTFFSKVKAHKMPFKTSYHLTLLVQEIEKHINYYQEQFKEIILEYGEKDEDGNLISSKDGQGVRLIEDTMAEAYTKIYELRNLDVVLPDYTFSTDDFNGIELSIEEMVTIMPFIKD